ncbi:hypothetical protein Krac_3620 [Ktedonobacter racemifer DSM 44963]|uniref:Uncharacterized protein n=1 Tax=Ktedonobacter racemifer DSM 44963 TaxID=485913 RepID=D6U2A2_KTERA|nr:hypothetical protein Krac_3620 [Ktedonobacter racemifer DSM 44963]
MLLRSCYCPCLLRQRVIAIEAGIAMPPMVAAKFHAVGGDLLGRVRGENDLASFTLNGSWCGD